MRSDDDLLEWMASRFNATLRADDGSLTLYNSFMGAVARVAATDSEAVGEALSNGFVGLPKGALAELCLNGFFVLNGTDEYGRLDRLLLEQHERTARSLQLILLPNEQCNFRCKYCSQTFVRKKMNRETIEGIVAHVAARAEVIEELTVGWFGGEPLTAPDVIDEVATRLRDICIANGVVYRTSSMTTNGYLLTPDIADMLFRNDVRGFQITIDGSPEHHDRLRVLGNGQGTFDRILSNLRALRDRADDFKIVIRVNFDTGSLDTMPEFFAILETEFAGDDRFCCDFHPVGRWGGPNDANLATCGLDEGRYQAIALGGAAIARGINADGLRGKLRRGGSKCYAARPDSFVIGSDGTVYKCTVAFEDPRNQIGKMHADGHLEIDEDLHRPWISTGADADSGCRSCFFAPACQGNACPLHRMDHGHRGCPTIKTNMPQVLEVLSGCSCAKPDATMSHGAPENGYADTGAGEADHAVVPG